MSWLSALVLAVLRDPQVRAAARRLVLAVLAAASVALGLGALLPPAQPPFGLSSSLPPLLW